MYLSHTSEIFGMIPAEKKRIFRRSIIQAFFSPISALFARPWAIEVGSKPPLLTRFARIGLGTRLDKM